MGLDVCTPSAVTVALFAGGENAITWTDPDACNLPRLTTVALTQGACVPVIATIPGNRPYRSVLIEFWRLREVTCNAPAPVPAAGPVAALTLRAAVTLNGAGTAGPFSGTCPAATDTSFADVTIVPGVCSQNRSFFGNPTRAPNNPWSLQVSYLASPNAQTPTNYDISVFSNNVLPGGVVFAGCGTPQSVNFVGTFFNVQVGEAASAACQVLTLIPAVPSNFLTPTLPVAFRVFAQRTYATSAVAPAGPAAPAENNTGIIVGSVGVAIAALLAVALGVLCCQVRTLRAQAAAGTGKPSAVPEWGQTQSAGSNSGVTKQPVGAGATAVPNPLAGAEAATTLPGTAL